jgi:hypothetical protein
MLNQLTHFWYRVLIAGPTKLLKLLYDLPPNTWTSEVVRESTESC